MITSLREKHLKNYMIPDRNLFLNKQKSDDEVEECVSMLKIFIKDMEATVEMKKTQMLSDNPIHRAVDRAILSLGVSAIQDIIVRIREMS